MNVISASRRTDIPAFYWRWFMRRIDDGFCYWVNPFNANQVFRVGMTPEDVAAVVFWTRNAEPMLSDIDRLESAGYRYYVQYTVNGYPSELEPRSPAVVRATDVVQRLSERIGPDRVIWRYDPIVLSSNTPPEYHYARFEEIADRVRGAVLDVYISFCDPYGRTERHFKAMASKLGWTFEFGTLAQHRVIAEQMRDLAGARGMRVYSCAEAGLDVPDVGRGSCIDPGLIARLRPDLDFSLRAAPTRAGCGCVQAVDIGVFDTCAFGCEYCYANNNAELPRKRMREHDPDDAILWRPPSLRGVDLADISAEQKSARIVRRRVEGQLSMFEE